MDVIQLVIKLAIGLGMGTLISIMSILSDPKNAWDNSRFAFSLVISVFSALTLLEGFAGGIDEDNVLGAILMIAGSSFFVNKGIQTASRLRNK